MFHFVARVLIAVGVICLCNVPTVKSGVAIPGLQHGPSPFESLFATGFTGGYNTFGSGTVAGAIGNYGRFVTGGASGQSYGGGGSSYGGK